MTKFHQMNPEQRAKRKAEIEREKAKRRKELENITVSDVIDSSNPTERQYGSMFNTMYKTIRKGLVLLAEKKKLHMITNEEAYNTAKELLLEFTE